MRQHSDELVDVLSGSFERELSVNVFNGSDRVLEDVRFESWQLDADLERGICTQGSGTIVHSSVDGSSLVPVGTVGVLSPFRARVEPVMTIRAGGFMESVSLGTFRVGSVPFASDSVVTYDGREMVSASRVGVKFDSLEADVERWGFQSPEQSRAGVSAFGELRRLTGMAVEETVADALVPALKVWEAKQGGRLDAVLELGRVLGGSAVVNSRGAWEIIPDVIGAPVATLRLGAEGTVIDVADEIDTDTVYNEVVGTFEDAKGKPIFAVARVNTGPLSVDGPYGVNTRYWSSDLVKTQAQANSGVQSILDQSVGSQQYDVQIQCHVNPLLEIGDVAQLSDWKRPLVGQVRKISLSNSPLMSVTLRVARSLT
ncbi:hypothetical protein [Microbacterium sp. W4I20]|uniref:hypothetical protein n=1 Tax=Microbacterium sp. W4I20 TaxID=3042262 RepID=UPI00278B40DD|nr:hypothetical protein [Microbacterium sp. W4I20]MDQ0726802.1 hypothetical protein [Microbacterium sp. W4I20]